MVVAADAGPDQLPEDDDQKDEGREHLGARPRQRRYVLLAFLSALGDPLTAGKTTILKSITNENLNNLAPTQGFTIKNIAVEGINLNIIDVGGTPR